MDEILTAVLKKIAEHIARLANEDRNKAMGITYRAMDFLLTSVRESTRPAPITKSK
jgi:hypothetical protein